MEGRVRLVPAADAAQDSGSTLGEGLVFAVCLNVMGPVNLILIRSVMSLVVLLS
jgi:hypothetical protein